MKVKEVMQKRVIKIKKNASYSQAVKILVKNKISGAPVVDSRGKLLGVVSEKDLFKAHYSGYFKKNDLKVEDLMTRKVIVVSPNDTIVSAGMVLLSRGIQRLPVVDKGKVVGIISREDIYSNIFKTEVK